MRLSIKELSDGMIIDEDIYTASGNLILNKGFFIEKPHLVKNILEQNDVSFVKVLIVPHQNDKTTTEKEIKETIKEEIRSFHEHFQENTSRIRDRVDEIVSGNTSIDFFQDFLDKALTSSNDNFLNIFQLMQKTKSSDDITFSHCYAVAMTTNTLGKWLGLQGDDLEDLTLAALLSDVGKTMVPNEILYKQGPLNEEEDLLAKNHVSYSGKLLEKVDLSSQIRSAIQFHHEREDGSGYPFGLVGDEIPYFAKIIAVADVYVALTSKRPYRRLYTPFEAMHILERDFIKTLDVTILTTFLKKISASYLGNPITLSNGQRGTIIFIGPHNYARPVIQIDDIDVVIDLSLDSNKDLYITEFN